MAASDTNGHAGNNGYSRVTWREVSQSHPCPKCERDHWCRYSEDGNWLTCRGLNDGSAKTKRDCNGDEYHSYCLNPELLSQEWPEPQFLPSPDAMRAEQSILNKVYEPLLTAMDLHSGIPHEKWTVS
jgi:hypothetical protein